MIRMRRSARSTLAAIAAALMLVALVGLGPARASGTTVVSLTFDDGAASEYSARAILAAHGMHGTFYIPSGLIGSYSYYMSWQQVEALASDGNEIGGHTSYHVNLPQIEAAEAQRQICADRDVLLSHGFPVTTFAYPYASQNAAVAQMVTDCGYNAVRPPGANNDPSLDTVKNAVTAAIAAGGGWVPIVFHDVCNGCTSLAISESDLSAYLDWLQQQSANGVVVKTIADVVGGAVKPAVQPPPAPAAPNGWNGVRNASLEQDSNGDSVPDCMSQGGYGTNTARWTRTTSAHTGSYAQRVDVSSYSSGDNKMMVLQDLGSCSPSVVPGHRYVITSWYNSTAPVYFTAYGRDQATLFAYWTESPTFPASSTWTQARWVTPVIPSNLTGLSFGLTLASTGSLTIDDVGIDDAASTSPADTSPPTVSLTAPASGATVSGVVQIAAQAADDVRLDHVDFLVDNQVVGSQVNAFPSFGWNSAAASNGEHTFAARAVDTSGNATTSSSVTAFVSNATVPNLLQNPSLETASGSTPTCWGLGGYGTNTFTWTRTSDAHTGSFGESVAISAYTSGDRKMVNLQDAGACAPAVTPGHTYTFTGWYKATGQPYVFVYYRNSAGSWVFWQQSGRPPASSWTKATYTTPPIPSGATRISIGMGIDDAVGSITMDDFSLVDTAPINPDTTPPTTSITCNNIQSEGGCATGYYPTAVAIQLTAVDNAGGSGVSSIRYTTDGTDPSLTNGNVYAGQFDTTTTVKYRAYDKAGNAEPIRTQQIRIDSVAPTATITCNGGACAASAYRQPVAIALQAADTGGSGVAAIRYTTDGSDPTAAGAATYAGPFSVSATTTVRYVALDNAGNVGPPMTQLVQVDSTAPTVALTAPADGATVSGTQVALAATASDDGAVTGVEFFVNGTSVGTDTTAPHSISWDSTTVADGPVSITATATDDAGNTSSTPPIGVTVVNHAPTVALTAPADGATVSGTSVPISATASDPGGVSRVDFYSGSTLIGSDTTAPYSITWDTTTGPDGQDVLTAQATNTAGLVGTSSAVTVSVRNDTTPPTVALTAPADGATVSGTSVAISATATDGSAVSQVQFLVGSTVVGTDTTAPYSITWDSTSVPDGSVALTARATDASGNVGTSSPVSVAVRNDTTPPTVALTAPADGATVSGSAVALSATASDGSALSQVEFLVDGTVVGTDTTAPYAISWDSTSVPDGSVSITARATDSSGNVGTSSAVTVSVRNDTTAPNVAVTAPADGATVSGTGVAVSATATDGSPITQVQFLVGPTVVGTDTTAPYSISWDSTSVADGTVAITAKATDSSGNVGTSSPVSVTVRNDTTPPTVAVTAPTAGATVSGTSVAISATATDDGAVTGVEFFVNGTSVGTDTTAPYSIAWDSTSVADGPVSITATATDDAGNASSTAPIGVTVVNHAPTVALTAPSDGATLSGSSVTISATAADDSAVTGVEFFVGGTSVGIDTTAPYSISWDSTGVADGPVSITATATDDAGNASTTTPIGVTVVNHAPTVALTAPADGATVSGAQVAVTATATDTGGVARVDFYRGTTLIGSDTTAPYSITWDTTTGPDGPAVLTAQATDTAGLVGTSSAVTVSVRNDTTAPSVTVTAPATGATVSGTSAPISATATDGSTITQVQFLVGSTVVGTDTTAPYSITWDSTTVPDGSVAITAKATDSSGNVGTSSAVSVSVRNDTTPPTVALTAPADGATVSGTQVALAATASDTGGVSRVDFYRGTTLIGTDTTAPYSITWDTTTVADGTVAITAKATDSSGNVGTSSAVSVAVRNDTTPPTVAVTAPAAGATVSGASVAISATATDASAVSQVQFLVGSTVVGTDTTAPYSMTWDSTTVPDGNVSITAKATDSSGNVATSSAVTVSVRNDTTPPSVAVTAPAAGATVSGTSVAVSATASDGSGVAQVEFLVGAAVVGTDTTAPYSITWDTTTVADGTVAITAKATDSSGNVGTSSAVSVAVRNDTTPPTVAVTAPAAGATVSGASVAISATATDASAVSQVQFLVGSTVVGTDTTAPYSMTWDSTTVPDGNVSITAKATDSSGNVGTSSAITVTVRNAVTSTVANASLEVDANADGVPDCFAGSGTGKSTVAYARVADAHTGTYAERMTVSGYKNGVRRFESVKDAGTCAIAVSSGRTYTLGLWFKSTAGLQLTVSYRNASGTWVSWVTSPSAPASTTWTQLTFRTPAIPTGATAVSFGVTVSSNATVTLDDWSIALAP